MPAIINPGMTEGEALFGQFELICGDAISVFIRSEVLSAQPDDYLDALYAKILQSPEFQPVKIEVVKIPPTESGQKFAKQFLNLPASKLPGDGFRCSILVPFKKARIMKHWAERIEVQVECTAIQEPEPQIGDYPLEPIGSLS